MDWETLNVQRGDALRGGIEHFGFRDGLSQPSLLGTAEGTSTALHGGRSDPSSFRATWYRRGNADVEHREVVEPLRQPVVALRQAQGVRLLQQRTFEPEPLREVPRGPVAPLQIKFLGRSL